MYDNVYFQINIKKKLNMYIYTVDLMNFVNSTMIGLKTKLMRRKYIITDNT